VLDEDYVPPDPEAAPKEPAARRYGARSMAELLEAVVVRAETQRPECGVTTGNFELDEAIGGFRRQRVTIVGAETSFGKSSFAVMCADEGLKNGAGVLLITGEDSSDTYGQRIMARRAQVNALRIRDNILVEDDIRKMKYHAGLAERTPFFLDGIGKPAEYLARAIRDICAENSIALVVVDYVQAFSCSKRCQDRRAEVTHIARLFIDAIKTSNAAGLVLSQLKRPENSTRAPTMHDLKESGDLENMAEHVLLGCLETTGEGELRQEKRSFIVGKNKDGMRAVDRIQMPFDAKTASFRTVAGQRFANRYEDSIYERFDGIADN
jgi:replicative DNA helicase